MAVFQVFQNEQLAKDIGFQRGEMLVRRSAGHHTVTIRGEPVCIGNETAGIQRRQPFHRQAAAHGGEGQEVPVLVGDAGRTPEFLLFALDDVREQRRAVPPARIASGGQGIGQERREQGPRVRVDVLQGGQCPDAVGRVFPGIPDQEVDDPPYGVVPERGQRQRGLMAGGGDGVPIRSGALESGEPRGFGLAFEEEKPHREVQIPSFRQGEDGLP